MITAKTYIKIKKKFVEFHDFNGKVQDPDYIEGAIELAVNGFTIIDRSMWDYVDQLWAYLTEGVVCVARGEDFKTFFPDQPIEMSFATQGDDVIMAVTVHETVRVVIDRSEFISEMKNFAIDFFEDLKNKGEKFHANSNFYLNKLRSI